MSKSLKKSPTINAISGVTIAQTITMQNKGIHCIDSGTGNMPLNSFSMEFNRRDLLWIMEASPTSLSSYELLHAYGVIIARSFVDPWFEDSYSEVNRLAELMCQCMHLDFQDLAHIHVYDTGDFKMIVQISK